MNLFKFHRRAGRRIQGIVLSVLALAAGTAVGQQPAANQDAKSIVFFKDEAEKAHLVAKNVFGGVDTKKYIIETTGTGVAVFDYDNDGWPDIFIVNGTTLESVPGPDAPTSHLYHNNHDGTFTDVTAKGRRDALRLGTRRLRGRL